MSPVVSKQHPAVVLRSHYEHLRSLLAIVLIALVAMAVAVVILASAGTSAPTSATAPAPSATTRYDGGPEEGTRGVRVTPSPSTTRYDGGPEEGTATRAVRSSR